MYLTPQESQGILKIPGGILGHIDVLQVFNEKVFVLDYKPQAEKERNPHVHLLLYALAVSKRCGVHLKNIICAWFDENDFFSFPAMSAYAAFKHG